MVYKIAVIPGDGIGKEVMPPALAILKKTAQLYNFEFDFRHFDFASYEYYEAHGKMLPDDWKSQLESFDAIYFGAVGVPDKVPDHISLWGSLLQFRREFDQFINLRPVKLIPGIPCPLASPGKIDFMVVRENTEGEYSSIGGHIFPGTEREIVIQETVMTRVGVDRIIRFAFDLARSRPERHLTNATKSNGIAITMPYWDQRFEAIARDYPDVRTDKFHIDILTAHFVSRPAFFDVVVGSNLFGDILSDLGPAVTGTIGIAPSANLSSSYLSSSPSRAADKKEGKFGVSLFEPVHGSAPDIAGRGIANPVGMIWAGSMMLDFLGEPAAGAEVLRAIEAVLARKEPGVTTRDIGGHGTTDTLGGAILDELRGRD